MANMKKLESKLRTLPNAPGVYQFLSENGRVIYVGKSLHLRQRVRSYFQSSVKWDKVNSMLPFIDDVRIITCDTHLEARLLECRLIKDLQPRFNLQMKGDSRYVFLELRPERLPRIRNVRTDFCVGPFRSKWNLKYFLDSVKLLCPLQYEEEEIRFDYHPIPERIDRANAEEMTGVLRQCLSQLEMTGKFQKAVEQKMLEASEELQYERAAFYQSLLPTLAQLVRSLGDRREFLEAEYHVIMPLGSAEKHFYIRDGLVMDKATAFSPGQFDTEHFISEARQKPPLTVNDKAALDFQDIVYTELEKLQDGQVKKLGSVPDQ